MRSVAWTLVLCIQQGWSFQIISQPLARPAHHRSSRRSTAATAAAPDGTISSTNSATSCSAVQPRVTARPKVVEKGVGIDLVRVAGVQPLVALRGFAAGFVAAALVLAADSGPALADTFEFPPKSPPTAQATTINTPSPKAGVSGEEVAPAVITVIPTTKLEGELAAQFQKAQSAGSVQQFDKAKKLYNQVVKYAPGYVYGWSNRGNVLIAEGDLKGAIADYDTALELASGLSMSDKWVIYLNRGTTFLALGDDERALLDLNQAARLNNQKDLYTLANRAQAYERKGDWAKALVDYEGAINVQPGNVQPWWIRYSLVLFEEGRDFDSLAFLRRVQAKFEGVGEVQAALTAVEFGRGDMKEAVRAWKGINKVDQQTFSSEPYLKNQLKWPPRIVKDLEGFIQEQNQDQKQEDVRLPVASTATAATS